MIDFKPRSYYEITEKGLRCLELFGALGDNLRATDWSYLTRYRLKLLVRMYRFFTSDIACDIKRLKGYNVNIVHLMQDNSQTISIQFMDNNE
jgi:hypothetical protein